VCGENYRIRSNYFYPSHNIALAIIETGGVFSTYVEEERRIQGFGGQNRGRETIWETQASMVV
jgi:hypothetical protein